MKRLAPLALILSLAACSTAQLGRYSVQVSDPPTLDPRCMDRLYPGKPLTVTPIAAMCVATVPAQRLLPPFRQNSPIERALRS